MKKTSLSLILFLAGAFALTSCNNPRESEETLRGPADELPLPTDTMGVDTTRFDTVERFPTPVHP